MLFIRHRLYHSMSVFTQKLNPLSGKSEWEVQDPEYDFHQEIARSAFADMLHDTERNKKYYRALKKAIDKMHSVNKTANVLDIGTGTGLLSMMAVKCGADSVTACEAFSPMAECALQIIKANGFENNIKVIPKCSLEIVIGLDMPQKANILVTEVFDTELIGEGAISTFSHAHKELLEKDCIVIPTSATVYAQVVESKLAQNWCKINPTFDKKTNKVILEVPHSIRKCSGSPAVHDIQLNQFPTNKFKTLISPIEVFSFDWSGKSRLLKNRNSIVTEKSENDGIAQAVFVWWDLQMDSDGKIILSCAPYWAHPDTKKLNQTLNLAPKDVLPWRDHWMQAVYFFPDEIAVKKYDEMSLISNHDEYSLWFDLKQDVKFNECEHIKPVCSCGLHLVFSRTRLGQLNDENRTQIYLRALKNNIVPDTTCLCLSDGSFLGFYALKFGAKKVIYVQKNSTCKTILEEFAKSNNLRDRIEFISEIDSCTMKDINLVIGEPFFLYSLLPWDNFYFMHLIKNYISSSITKEIKFLPRKAQIRAMAVHFYNLNKIKSKLNFCEEFQMDIFDKLIKDSSEITDAKIEPQPLWEYTGIALSKPTTIYEIFISSDIQLKNEVKTNMNFQSTNNFNGIALWVDWFLDETSENVITTGPVEDITINSEIKWDIHTKQGVYLLENSVEVQVGEVFQSCVTCSQQIDQINFSFLFKEQYL